MLRLMWEFFKTGLFAVGGGMATIPFLQEMARNYSWFSEQDLLDMIAVSESTPGAIGINIATYAGYSAYGIPGALAATLSLITGPTIIVLIIARAMARFRRSKTVSDMFVTIRPATAGLILGAMSSVMVVTLFNADIYRQTGSFAGFIKPIPVVLFIIILSALIKFKKIHPLAIIAISALCGVIFGL